MRFGSELITISFRCFPCSRYWCEARDWWEVWCNDRSISIYDLPLSILFRVKQTRVWYQLRLTINMTMLGLYSNSDGSECGSVALIPIKDCWVGFALVSCRCRPCRLITNVLIWWRITHLLSLHSGEVGGAVEDLFLCCKIWPGSVNDSDWLWWGWWRFSFSFYLQQADTKI